MFKLLPFKFLPVLFAVLAASCSSTDYFVTRQSDLFHEPLPGQGPVEHGIVLVGNLPTGNSEESSAYFRALREGLAGLRYPSSTLVVLGDFIPASGIPDSGAVGYEGAIANIRHLDALKDTFDEIIVIPGDSEWSGGRPHGLGTVLDLNKHFEYLDKDHLQLVPADGLPGPDKIKISKDILLIAVDSQWWLHRYDRPYGDAGDYHLSEPGDFLLELDEILKKNTDKVVILAMHHPPKSNGIRGGHFPLSYHLAPVPIAGSVMAMYRKLAGRPQDLQHTTYRNFRKELEFITGRHENLIIASGHDPGLQYITSGPRHTPQHHIVSAAGQPALNITPDGRTVFASTYSGFAAIEVRSDNSVTLTIRTFTPGESFTALLYQDTPPVDTTSIQVTQRPAFPPHVNRAINDDYDIASNFLLRALIGKQYRKAWAAPVTLPTIDFSTELGGLTPVKSGGRGQSITLRVQSESGREYTLRSVDKVAGKAWTPELRRTFAQKIIQDQISLMFPFSALLVPPLADAVGVYHANPRLFYIPDDPLLGPYRQSMSGQVVMMEERPDEDLSDLDSFGNTENAVSYRTMFRKLDNDNDNRVDQLAFARARLFDILISDWDRHEDQWRWAEFENPDKGVTFRPIPRDRDAAFMTMGGLFPRLAQLSALRIWQDFDYDFGYLKGLTRNGLRQDRRLTSELTTDDWVTLANDIKSRLTDEIINDAFQSLPDTIRSLYASRMSSILRHRRDNLPDVASRFSRLLARDVDIVGSNKHEEFVVERLDEDSTRVTVYKIKKEGDRRALLYSRTFLHEETRNLFLYGLDGHDRFYISGDVKNGIAITAVGGPGPDYFEDTSTVAGFRKKTRVLDTSNNVFEISRETKLDVSDDPDINRYNPRAYKHNGLKPVSFIGSNKDDGLFLGGGFVRTVYGFRKLPYKKRYSLAANFASRTNAFNIKYAADWTEVFDQTDLELDGGVFSPNNIHNFYGLGNETTSDSASATFYQARLEKVDARMKLRYHIAEFASMSAGPIFHFTDVRRDSLRFVNDPQAGINPLSFKDQMFAGLLFGFQMKSLDNATNPHNGFAWSTSVDTRFGMINTSSTFSTVESDLRIYFPVSYHPQVTLATRFGGRHIEGSFPFYAASTLGGNANLRGYRGTRFAGRTSAFSNVELRAELVDFSSYLTFGRLGLSAFYDTGRVWTDGESSEKLHYGYGGGVWALLYGSLLINTTYAISPEDRTFAFGIGFRY